MNPYVSRSHKSVGGFSQNRRGSERPFDRETRLTRCGLPNRTATRLISQLNSTRSKETEPLDSSFEVHWIRSSVTRRRSITAAAFFSTGRTVRVVCPAASRSRPTSRATKCWK